MGEGCIAVTVEAGRRKYKFTPKNGKTGIYVTIEEFDGDNRRGGIMVFEENLAKFVDGLCLMLSQVEKDGSD